MASVNRRYIGIFSFSLVAVGMTASIYLFQQHLQLAKGSGEHSDLCSTLFEKGCNGALQYRLFDFWELPLAGWGILFYTSFAIFLLLPAIFGPMFNRSCQMIIFFLSIGGLMAALTLLAIMAWTPSIFCPVCAIIHVTNIILFVTMHLQTRKRYAPQISGSTMGDLPEIQPTSPGPLAFSWTSLGMLSSLLVVGALFLSLQTMSRSASSSSSMVDVRPVLNSFQNEPVRMIPTSRNSPQMGRQGSKVTVVVFSDFFCQGCRILSKEIRSMEAIASGTCQVIFRHFPLDSDCNTLLKKNIHPQSCAAARSAIAAHQQGKFWPFHDALFEHSSKNGDDDLLAIAKKTGLNQLDFDLYRHSQAASIQLQQDIAAAHMLGINATPTVFINGRQLKNLRPGMLTFMVNQLTQKTDPEQIKDPSK